jgi:hypothetical protein
MDTSNFDILNENEINELKSIFKEKCCDYFINDFSRKIYNLFIHNIIFNYASDCINENNNDSYYLGVYYRFININYALAKKYYLMAIDKGNANAMNNLGYNYQYTEENYDLMKKYYLMAIDKGNTTAMNNLAYHYEYIVQNYDLMKKYYLMAIENGNVGDVNYINDFYKNHPIGKKSLKKLILSIIKSHSKHIYLKDLKILSKIYLNHKCCNIICEIIDNNIMCTQNFIFCVNKIINYIYEMEYYSKLKKISHFFTHITILYYEKTNDKIENEKRKYIHNLLNTNPNISQLFMEYLEFYYYEYLKKEFVPGGEKSIEIKNHFETIAKKVSKINKI